MSIQERLYRLITSIGLLGLIFGVAVDMIAGKNIADISGLDISHTFDCRDCGFWADYIFDAAFSQNTAWRNDNLCHSDIFRAAV